ncbi:thaumatin [Mycena vitilis]|nr:thaumatin [Mycena vitilis]
MITAVLLLPQLIRGCRWEAASFTKVTFTVPNDWVSDGRVWGRRGCDFSTNPGPNSCIDGGCNGGLLCDVNTGTGVPPATLAKSEFLLSSTPYTQALTSPSSVIGTHLSTHVGCAIPSCPVDLAPNCPASQIGPFDPSNFPVGCKSACLVDAMAGNAGNSPNCCSGSHDTAATCPPSSVTNYAYFKDNVRNFESP